MIPLYKILENANQSIVTGNRSMVQEERSEEARKGGKDDHEGPSGGDRYVCYLDCGNAS